MKYLLRLLSKNLVATIAVVVLIIGGATYFVIQSATDDSEPKNDDTSKTTDDDSNKVDETGYIYVDGSAGILTKASIYDNMSYIGEAARGTEVYLAAKGSMATYLFNADKAGSYRLEISLSDDAVHDDGSRDATVVMNGGGMVFYKHRSENTNGWKWYSLGILTVKPGENTITFTKDETSSAAFVMDQFRLVPVVISE